MSTRRTVLSGIKPTGKLHLGNYFGAMRQFLDLQEAGHELFIFVADYHALTTISDADTLRGLTADIVLDYLAVGLDPERSTLFRQSDVPEVTELAWILDCVCPKGLLDRAHAYKDAMAREQPVSMGLYNYPVLMAADILIYGSHLVPVGKDQKQHVEYAQDLQEKLNNTFGAELLTRPEPMIQESTATVIGMDGQKMSKSYGNTIEIFEPGRSFEKKIKSMVTDSKGVEEAKDPETCNVFALYRLFDPEGAPALADRYRAGGMGYGHAKQELIAAASRVLDPLRDRRAELAANPEQVDAVLQRGAGRARARAGETMDRVRKATGLR